jgi:hypothetical protein
VRGRVSNRGRLAANSFSDGSRLGGLLVYRGSLDGGLKGERQDRAGGGKANESSRARLLCPCAIFTRLGPFGHLISLLRFWWLLHSSGLSFHLSPSRCICPLLAPPQDVKISRFRIAISIPQLPTSLASQTLNRLRHGEVNTHVAARSCHSCPGYASDCSEML